MVFDLCFNVAEGKDFWAYKTQKCDVLYDCLEDPEWRIVDRWSTRVLAFYLVLLFGVHRQTILADIAFK